MIKIIRPYAKKIKANKQFTEGIRYIMENDITDLDTINEVLSQGTITFEMRINRLQSLILCELQDSYSVQSQRYCRYSADSEVIIAGYDKYINNKDLAQAYITSSLSTYLHITKIKEGHENAVKFKKDDFEFGIPIEDGRSILPMVFPCYQVMTIRGDKFMEFVSTVASYNILFDEIWRDISNCIPIMMLPRVIALAKSKTKTRKVMEDKTIATIKGIFDRCPEDMRNDLCVVEVDDPLRVSGAAALTCTNEICTSELLERNNLDKVANRVIGMGHVSVGEHTTVNIGASLSVGAYNQYVRHRHHKLNRIAFSTELKDIVQNGNDFKLILSDEIQAYDTESENINKLSHLLKLVCVSEKEKTELSDEDFYEVFSQFMMMGTAISFVSNSNLTNELYIAEKRTCLNAQWEIRQFTHAKLKFLKHLLNNNPVLDRAMPPCLKGGCKEGRGSCGDNSEVRKLFNK